MAVPSNEAVGTPVPPFATTEALRDTGRSPFTPFNVRLEDGGTLTVSRLLRVLPGKRLVGEGTLDGERVLVKLFTARNSRRHMEREHSGILALSEAGIATPPLLRCGDLQGSGHYLLTRFLDDAHTLAEIATGPHATDSLLLPAIRMLGNMHRRGLIQTDLHLGNFLMQGDNLYMLDGDAIEYTRKRQPVGARVARKNLALLLAQFPISRADYHATWITAYQESNPGIAFDDAGFEAEKRRVRNLRLRDYLKKCVRDCTMFKVEKRFSRFSAVVRTKADWLAPLLADPDACLSRGKLLKSGNTSTVVQVDLDGHALVIKRYNIKGVAHAISRAWRPSRAWHAWLAGHRLIALGIPTAAPLALIEQRLGPMRGQAWLITELIDGPDLHQHWAQYVDSVLPEGDKETILRLMQDLAVSRITHGDLKASNLIWHDGKIILIDLDAMKQHQTETVFSRNCQRDMMRLASNWPSRSALHEWLTEHLGIYGFIRSSPASKPENIIGSDH